jgi:hypothetical protein
MGLYMGKPIPLIMPQPSLQRVFTVTVQIQVKKNLNVLVAY